MQDIDDAPTAQPQLQLHITPTIDRGGDDAAAAHELERSFLLRTLPREDYAWLHPRFTPVRLESGQALAEPGVPLGHAWFVRHGAASIIALDPEGGSVEAVGVGFEGFVGLPLLLEDDTPANRVIVSVEGDAWRITADDFRRVLAERPNVRRTCARYASFVASQLAQAVACNRNHTLENRCAQWLLRTHDRVHHQSFAITHEFLAPILGVRRAGVTVAMGALQGAGAIHYHRGRVTIVDRAKLERAACSCYQVTEAGRDRLA
jgi:CRP-like cAMP-binding protein